MKNSNRQLFISNTVFNTGFKLVNQIIALFILPLFVKNLGADLYGIWVISGIVIGYLGIMDLGFSTGVMRYISKAYATNDYSKFNKIINTASVLFLFIGTIILLIIVLFHAHIVQLLKIRPENIKMANELLIITGIFAPILWTIKITDSTYQGILKFKEYSILSGMQNLGRTITMIYLVYNNFGIIDIAIITNIIFILLWIPSLVVLFKVTPGLSFGSHFFSFAIIKEIAPFSAAVFYSELISMLALQADNLIVGIAISMSTVTAYVVASKLFNISLRNLAMLSGVLQPTSYQAFAKNDKVLINKIMSKGTKYSSMIYSSISYLGIIVSYIFIKTWMGEDYIQYAIWSQVFMLVLMVTGGFGIPINLVFNSGKTIQPNIVKTVSIFINIAISILLVKKLGIGGPILGTLIAGFFTSLTFPYFCKLLGVEWKIHAYQVLKIILINLPSSIVFYWISFKLDANWINLIGLSLLIISVQSLTLYFTFFTTDEKKDLRIFFEILGLFKIKRMIRKV